MNDEAVSEDNNNEVILEDIPIFEEVGCDKLNKIDKISDKQYTDEEMLVVAPTVEPGIFVDNSSEEDIIVIEEASNGIYKREDGTTIIKPPERGRSRVRASKKLINKKKKRKLKKENLPPTSEVLVSESTEVSGRQDFGTEEIEKLMDTKLPIYSVERVEDEQNIIIPLVAKTNEIKRSLLTAHINKSAFENNDKIKFFLDSCSTGNACSVDSKLTEEGTVDTTATEPIVTSGGVVSTSGVLQIGPLEVDVMAADIPNLLGYSFLTGFERCSWDFPGRRLTINDSQFSIIDHDGIPSIAVSLNELLELSSSGNRKEPMTL